MIALLCLSTRSMLKALIVRILFGVHVVSHFQCFTPWQHLTSICHFISLHNHGSDLSTDLRRPNSRSTHIMSRPWLSSVTSLLLCIVNFSLDFCYWTAEVKFVKLRFHMGRKREGIAVGLYLWTKNMHRNSVHTQRSDILQSMAPLPCAYNHPTCTRTNSKNKEKRGRTRCRSVSEDHEEEFQMEVTVAEGT